MNIQEIMKIIENDDKCVLKKKESKTTISLDLPPDLKYFYEHYEYLEMFPHQSFGIKIVSIDNFIETNKRLYPEGDVIWEELEGHISSSWYLIAEAQELSQYISLDMSDSPSKGYCYDSFYEIHAMPGECAIIAKSFTELVERLYQAKGESWYWTEPSFESYGDAYDIS